MAFEYVYYNENQKDVILQDDIKILSSYDDNNKFFISNSKKVDALVYASEIDFYLDNSQDDTLEKAKNTTLLYEARAIIYDMASYVDYEQVVLNDVVVISNHDEKALVDALVEKNFKAICLKCEQIEYIDGILGNIEIAFDNKFSVQTNQVIYKDMPKNLPVQSGIINLTNNDEIIAQVCKNQGQYKYKNFITYNSNICQYHERREEICSKCEAVCPSVAITKNDETKELIFSHIDCIGCGKCVGVCPSGSLDFTLLNEASLQEISKLYKNKTILIISKNIDLSFLKLNLPKNVLPLVVENENFIHEAHLLTLLQESGNEIVFYLDEISSEFNDCVSFINDIYLNIYGKKVIFASSEINLVSQYLENLSNKSQYLHSLNYANLNKREIFSKRVSHLVDNDYGKISLKDNHLQYGHIHVDNDLCTLCLSCAAACNMGAFSIDTKENTLSYNASLCTLCTYCKASCPENCLSIYDEFLLKKESFEYIVLARDELFKCIECGKEFATKKSVEKIKSIMEPKFKGNDLAIKTLSCCADCKAKLTIKSNLVL